jgi:uncharacterized OB-fold protein
MMVAQVPLVDYLVLGGPPRLQARQCAACGATYFDRRNGCARCFATEFHRVDVQDEGVVTAFTVVNVAAPGVRVPFVPAVIDCAGIKVKANLVNVEASPDHVRVGMKVRLATFVVGRDEAGTEAIGYGFEPIGA